MKLRKVQPDDALFLFDLRNEASVRLFSFHTEEISLETHQNWFQKKLTDPKSLLLISEENGVKIGQIRFDADVDLTTATSAEVNIAVVTSYWGKGYGAEILRQGCQHIFQHFPIEKIEARLKEGNISSERIFIKAGFSHCGEGRFQDQPTLEMALKK